MLNFIEITLNVTLTLRTAQRVLRKNGKVIQYKTASKRNNLKKDKKIKYSEVRKLKVAKVSNKNHKHVGLPSKERRVANQ